MLNTEVFEIVPVNPYTSADLNYRDSSSRAYQEDRNTSARPAIEAYDTAIDSYDTLFIGFPIWFGDMPKVMYTFLIVLMRSGRLLFLSAQAEALEFKEQSARFVLLSPMQMFWMAGESIQGIWKQNLQT